jgi:hypothetical protein
MADREAKPDETPAQRRPGRPTKAPRKGQRYQIGVIVTGETKAVITKAAKESGRTISREVEILIEKALQYDRLFERTRMTAEEIASQSEDAALMRRGYTPVHTSHGKVWYPPGWPGLERFVEYKPGEPQPEPVEVPPPEPMSEQEAARNLRDHEERIARLEALAKGAKQ